jgi:hypothetical protein
MNSANCCIVPPDSDLRCLRAHTAMCALRIDKLRQHPAEILLLGRHAEQNTFSSHVPVENLDIGDGETQFHFSCWVLVGSRVQRESGFARHELAPARRFELKLETQNIAVELNGLPMTDTNLMTYLSCVPCICYPLDCFTPRPVRARSR